MLLMYTTLTNAIGRNEGYSVDDDDDLEAGNQNFIDNNDDIDITQPYKRKTTLPPTYEQSSGDAQRLEGIDGPEVHISASASDVVRLMASNNVS